MKLLIAIFLVFAYTSCTLSVSPDGTRTYGVDADTAIEILNNK
jgi:hypothetical protein